MSSYACVYLQDGRPVCWFRNGVDQLFFILFSREDRIQLDGAEAYALQKGTYSDLEVEEAFIDGFRTTAKVIRDRLDLLGVPVDVVGPELERLATERMELLANVGDRVDLRPEMRRQREQELDFLRDLTWKSWLTGISAGLDEGQPVNRFGRRDELGSLGNLMSLWDDHDDRYRLRAILEALPDDEVITLDLSDILEGGWLDPAVDPRDHANALVAYTSQGGLPPVVLAEGRFDVEVLSTALRLRRPHLVGYVRFPDFNQKPEGGAAALRQTLRAFASAGIPNRVVALFDNDTAARDVLHSLNVDSLPPNLVVTTLPELEIARDYPTVGPQGEHRMDVNGLAASIELFLGDDVLTRGSDLLPVVWGGYVRRLNAYQGEVSDKEDVHERFRSKVDIATRSPQAMASQDWSGLDLVLNHVLDLLAGMSLTDDGP